MIDKKFFIFLIFLVSACGYTPIYKGLSDINFEINITQLKGDSTINNHIRNDLARYREREGSNKDLYTISINSEYEKSSISKNLSGDDTSYELRVVSKINITSEKFTDELIIVEKLNMANMSDDFEENEYEQTIKVNFANSIVRKLISRISQIQ